MESVLRAERELVPVTGEGSFAVRSFDLDAFDSPWHFHPECELTYIAESCGQRFVGDSIEPFAAGDLVLMGPDLPHVWRNEPRAANARWRARSVVVQFRLDCLGRDFLALPELRNIDRMLRRAAVGLQITGAARDEAAARMIALEASQGVERILGLLGILELLARSGKACRELASAGLAAAPSALHGERLAAVCDHVLDHFAGEIRLEEMARLAGLSPSAFCRCFRRATGKTLFAFLAEVRIGQACRLLLDTDRNISEIAFACGYNTLSVFNEQFRRLRGVSPRDFRRRHLQTVQ